MRVLIAEDSVLLREGLARLLEMNGLSVTAAVGDADALVASVAQDPPDLAVIDVRMPPDLTDDGLRAAIRIRREQPGVAIVVLSQSVEERYANELLATGTERVGYLLKDRVADVQEFIDAVRRVAGGGTALDPEVVSQLLLRRRSPIERLSPREREVLEVMAQGRSNSGIAGALSISESAVAKHINAIFTKLDITGGEEDHRRVLAVLRYLGVEDPTDRASGGGRP
ncbi:response regulator transcription factor [Kineosporia sp. J2-2]|uniref:Response regulator transcription factor n=1 Tax=Kineosporia corallincola TaxID=2835133 RepID=A0ABS5TKI1_9ACTN|nr:response regulator transcription factor [Kineosporia corallincola]MBT0770094.1 response regulator transcription factor [Kineosporia corallincola]